MTAVTETVAFTQMKDGTKEDYDLLLRADTGDRQFVADNALALLGQMAGDAHGYQIDRYQHSLQTATRALRDGADEETIVCAVLHDIGDMLAPSNHSELAAAVLRPYVSEENHWIVKHHGAFQGYYFFHHRGGDRNAREAYRGAAHFEACVHFCEAWDQASFDPAYDTLPLEAFEPMVRAVFARNPAGFA